MKKLLLAALALTVVLGFTAPAEAAKLQRFWVHNFSQFDIVNVYALDDIGHGNRDLMGSSGILYYNPQKVPDSVLVLAPNKGGSCYSRVRIVGYDSDNNAYNSYFGRINLCTTGQSISIFDSNFN